MDLPDRPYQQEGARFLADRQNALLAFDTRLGKTRTALRAAQLVQAQRVLVIAPAIARIAWKIEAPLVTNLPLQVMAPGAQPAEIAVTAHRILMVLSYDTFSLDRHGWLDALLKGPPWDVLILDECQYLKSAGSNRTIAIYGKLRHHAVRTWCLSATPTPNHAGEMWPHAKALWPEALPEGVSSRHAFEDRYCNVELTPYGRRIKGSRNQRELRDRLAPFVLRKRKRDVFRDMPRMAHSMIPLDMTPGKLEPGEWDEAVSELDKLLSAPPTEETMSILRELGEAKAAPAANWVREQLDGDAVGKIVVFAWHLSVLDRLKELLADFDPCMVTGSTPAGQREAAVRDFQRKDARRLFLGQVKAAGTAICLDAADDCAIIEPSWTPMDNYQAASRIENVGLRKATTVSWLYAPGTLDEHVMGTLRRKTREISVLWD